MATLALATSLGDMQRNLGCLIFDMSRQGGVHCLVMARWGALPARP